MDTKMYALSCLTYQNGQWNNSMEPDEVITLYFMINGTHISEMNIVHNKEGQPALG